MSGFELKQYFVPCGSENCYISYLPCETLTQIFSYLKTVDLVSCIKTCQHWRSVINGSEKIWRNLCLSLTESYSNIWTDRLHGFTWKEIYQRHYGSNGIKHLWKQGVFSQPAYQQLPEKPFCRFDTDTWGQILQWELDRT